MRPETLKERMAVTFATTTTINAGGTASLSSPGINMGGGPRRLRAFLVTGTLTGAASVNFSLQQSATQGGSYSAITAGLTTVPSVTGITADDAFHAIEISSDLLGTADKPWVKAIVTETATANAVVTLVVIAEDSQYKPGRDFNSSTTILTNDVVAAV